MAQTTFVTIDGWNMCEIKCEFEHRLSPLSTIRSFATMPNAVWTQSECRHRTQCCVAVAAMMWWWWCNSTTSLCNRLRLMKVVIHSLLPHNITSHLAIESQCKRDIHRRKCTKAWILTKQQEKSSIFFITFCSCQMTRKNSNNNKSNNEKRAIRKRPFSVQFHKYALNLFMNRGCIIITIIHESCHIFI